MLKLKKTETGGKEWTAKRFVFGEKFQGRNMKLRFSLHHLQHLQQLVVVIFSVQGLHSGHARHGEAVAPKVTHGL